MNDQFDSKEYRDEYVVANLQNGVAYQIRALRHKEGWSQGELGKRCNKAQNVISRLEDPDYGKFTISTLLNIASAFDVALSVRFVSFGELLAQTKDLSPDALAVPNFSQERMRTSKPEPSEAILALSTPVFRNAYPAMESYVLKDKPSVARSALAQFDNPSAPPREQFSGSAHKLTAHHDTQI